MKKEMVLNIIDEMSKNTLAEYILELQECIKKNDKAFDEEFFKDEFICERWLNVAMDELGGTGLYFAYFVAGFRCCEAIK